MTPLNNYSGDRRTVPSAMPPGGAGRESELPEQGEQETAIRRLEGRHSDIKVCRQEEEAQEED